MTTLSELGALFITGLSGSALSPVEARQLKKLRPSGVILFKHNIAVERPDWCAVLLKLLADVKTEIGRDDLLVSVDHEGGRVHRFPSPVTHFPAAVHWKGRAAEAAGAMARELRSLGFNLSYAPVLDVWSEPKNTVIGDRAFSADAEETARRGCEAIAALHREGVVACGKHFPGHGATIADSHFELPVLELDRSSLDRRELMPFKAAIAADLRLIMSAHVLYPKLDSKEPATFSSAILKRLLREQLGFRHAVITDDLEMLGVAGVELSRRGTKALAAGADLLLAGNPKDRLPLEHAIAMADGVAEALRAGELESSRIDEAQRRCAALRAFAMQIKASAGADLEAAATLGCEQHRRLCSALRAG